MKFNINLSDLANMRKTARNISAVKSVVDSRLDNTPKRIITRDIIRKRNNSTSILFGLVFIIVPIFMGIMVMSGVGNVQSPLWVIYLLLGVFLLIGVFFTVRSIMLKRTIANDNLTVEEDVILDSFYERKRDSDGDVHTYYYVDLLYHGQNSVPRHVFTESFADDIAYLVLSEKNKVLGIFPKKLWDVSPDLMVTSRVAEDDSITYHQEITTQEFETPTIDNTFETKTFKLKNTFEK